MFSFRRKCLLITLFATLFVFESGLLNTDEVTARPKRTESVEGTTQADKADKTVRRHHSRRHKDKSVEIPLCSAECSPVSWLSSAMEHGAGQGAVRGVRVAPLSSELPKNTRQIKEGYWIGSLPTVENIDALHQRNIRLIISATRLDHEFAPINARIDQLGIKHIILPFGGKFPKASRFYAAVQNVPPEKTYIHCDHGGDRSGAILAYILIKRHGWSVSHALLAVLYPGDNDVKGLKEVLESRGYSISDQEIKRYLGIYSGELNGGGGGLKVRSEDYKKLVNTMLDTLQD